MQQYIWTRLMALVVVAAGSALQAADPELVDVRAIWSRAPHNAFTDLVRFNEHFYCVFREGSRHVSNDGTIRVISSTDGDVWVPLAQISVPGADLRDPKLSITARGELMLLAGASYPAPAEVASRSMSWLSRDGKEWTGPNQMDEPNLWLWRVSWYMGRAFGLAYHTVPDRFVRMFVTRNGTQFESLGDNLYTDGFPNESTLLFLPNDTAICLLRRDEKEQTAQLGSAQAPFRGWHWRDLGVRVGGPALLQLPDGRIIMGGRLYDGQQRTSLCWLDPDAGKLTEFLKLPSGGDSSYPGMVYHKGFLWVSYYSSHEGKTRIYFAKIRMPREDAEKTKPKPLW